MNWPKSFVKTAQIAKNCALCLASCYKRHRKDLNILLELVTIVLVGFYAYEAWWQAYEGRLTATAVHENAVEDLRAYISVGGPPDHKMAEIRIDPTGSITIPVFFFNGGRTPAHHFMATIRTHVGHAHDQGIVVIDDIKRDGPHIERFVYLDNGERSNSGGLDIAANSPHVVDAHIDTTNMTLQDLTDIRNGGGKIVVPPQGGPREYPFLSIRLLGTFEYCDEFRHQNRHRRRRQLHARKRRPSSKPLSPW